MRFPVFALLLLSWPIAEITLFAFVAGKIGILSGLLMLVAAMLAGGLVLRIAGTSGLLRMQTAMAAGESPGKELANSALIFVSAMLLIVPGFASDVVGLVLLLPFVRNLVWKWFAANSIIVQMPGGFPGARRAGSRRGEPGVVDLDPDEFSVHEAGEPHDNQTKRRLDGPS